MSEEREQQAERIAKLQAHIAELEARIAKEINDHAKTIKERDDFMRDAFGTLIHEDPPVLKRTFSHLLSVLHNRLADMDKTISTYQEVVRVQRIENYSLRHRVTLREAEDALRKKEVAGDDERAFGEGA